MVNRIELPELTENCDCNRNGEYAEDCPKCQGSGIMAEVEQANEPHWAKLAKWQRKYGAAFVDLAN